MTGFRVTAFAGAVPGRAARLLERHQAQSARNVRLRDGDIVPYKAATHVIDLAKAGTMQTIFRYELSATTYWFHWTQDIDVVEGPVPNDTDGRVYWTGESEPRMSYYPLAVNGGSAYPMDWYTLGIPAPTAAPSASVSGSADDPSDLGTDRSYVYTYVTGIDEEGPPSNPSNIVVWRPGQTVDLSGMSTGPSGNYNVTKKRIYRTAVGADGQTDYHFIDEIDVADTSYNDSVSTQAIGESLPSTTWVAPPTDMIGLKAMPNGIMIGHRANEVCFSEPFIPHAWPTGYRLQTEDDIVAIGVFGNSAVVTTRERPYIVTGADPSAMAMQDAEVPYACVSKRGLVEAGNAVLWPSPEGLVRVGTDGINLVTAQLFTEAQWQAYKPESFDAYLFDGHYLAFYDDGATKAALMIAPDGSQAIDLDLYAPAAWRDAVRGILYVVVNGNEIHRYDNGAALTAHWRSAEFRTPPRNMGAGQVDADSYPVTVKVYGDGAQQASVLVADADPFPLPGGYRARRWSVEVEADARVRELAIAESVDDEAIRR